MISSIGEELAEVEPYHVTGWNVKRYSYFENSFIVSQQFNSHMQPDPVILLMDIYPKEI